MSQSIIGQKFHHLLVLEEAAIIKGRRYFKCVCECGTEVVREGSRLKIGRIKSCGCALKKPRPHARKGLGEAARNYVIDTYKRNAQKRGLVFDLPLDLTLILLSSKCFYCGAAPSSVAVRNGCYGTFTYNGIDRLDNTQGYTFGNSVSCCTDCNFKKGKQHVRDFLAWIQRVHNTPRPFLDLSRL
jgi:hypothetical protein